MGHVEIDSPNLLIARIDHPNLSRNLNEVDRRRSTVCHKTWNTGWLAARVCRVRDLSGENLVIVLLHMFLYPWLQVRIAEISDPIRRLTSHAVRNERVCGIASDRRQTPRAGFIEWTIAVKSNPSNSVRGEVG